MLYQGMKDQGIGKAELARNLGWLGIYRRSIACSICVIALDSIGWMLLWERSGSTSR